MIFNLYSFLLQKSKKIDLKLFKILFNLYYLLYKKS